MHRRGVERWKTESRRGRIDWEEREETRPRLKNIGLSKTLMDRTRWKRKRREPGMRRGLGNI